MPILTARFPGQRVRGPLDYNRLLSAFLVEHQNLDSNYHNDKINLGSGVNNDDKGLTAFNLSGQHNMCYRDSVGRWGAIVGAEFKPFAFLSEVPLNNDFLVHTDATGLPNGITTFALISSLYIQGADTIPVKIQIGKDRVGTDDTVCFPAGFNVGDPDDGLVRHTTLSGLTFTDVLVGGAHSLKNVLETSDRSYSPAYRDSVEYDPLGSTGTMSEVYNATDKRTYYHWTSAQPTSQNRYRVIRHRIFDFHSWSAGIRVTYKTSVADGRAQINVTMLDTDGNAATLIGGTGLENTSVTTTNVLVDSGTFTDGGYITLLLECVAEDGESVYLSDVQLSYY